MRNIFFISVFALLHLHTAAQLQNYNWCFGQLAGVRFNALPPSTYKTNIFSDENCATVSHRRTGALLFYTDGVRVFDSTHHVMPDGYGVGTDVSGTSGQGTVIVPFQLDTNKYYIFTVEDLGSANGYLRYSVVDMSLNNGLGDIVSLQKGIIIDSNLTEALTTINSCSQTWLATVKRGTNDFNLLRITPSGIDPTRVLSQKNYLFGSNGLTMLKFSRDVSKLAVATFNGTFGVSYLALHKFNVSTGEVLDGIIIDSVIGKDEFYGCEFSLDSRKLFTTAQNSKHIYQYNLSLNNKTAIRNSRQTIYTSLLRMGSLQAGPDNNIYVTTEAGSYLGMITNCNAMSPGCTYTPQAIPLFINTAGLLSLPQSIRFTDEKPYVVGTRKDTVICYTDSYNIQAEAGHQQYTWQDSSTNSYLTIHKSGVYTVQIVDSCFEHTDTFGITIDKQINVSLGNDTAICEGSSLVLRNLLPTVGTPLWSTGSTDSIIKVSAIGNYKLTVAYNNCSITDSLYISRRPSPVVYIGKDTAICEDVNIVLQSNPQPAGSQYTWNTGSTNNNIITEGKGRYTLTVNTEGCSTSHSIYIDNIPLPRIELGNDTVLCIKEMLQLPKEIVTGLNYSLLWQDGSANAIFYVNKEGKYNVQLTNICGVVRDSIQVRYHSCSIWLPTVFSPNGDGKNDVIRMVGDIGNVSVFKMLIYNRWGQNVYTGNDITQGWDGFFKGQPAEVGTYYYVLRVRYKELEEVWKGDINLMR